MTTRGAIATLARRFLLLASVPVGIVLLVALWLAFDGNTVYSERYSKESWKKAETAQSKAEVDDLLGPPLSVYTLYRSTDNSETIKSYPGLLINPYPDLEPYEIVYAYSRSRSPNTEFVHVTASVSLDGKLLNTFRWAED